MKINLKNSLCFLLITSGNPCFGFFEPEDELELAQRISADLKHSHEKDIIEKIGNIESRCHKLGFSSQKVFQHLLRVLDYRIDIYEQIINKSLSLNSTIGFLSAGAAFFMLLFYIIYSNFGSEELLKNDLKKLGAENINNKYGSYASARVSILADEREVRRRLYLLANTPDRSTTFLYCVFTAGLAGLFGFATIEAFLDKFYSEYYYKKFCFIKQKLEEQII